MIEFDNIGKFIAHLKKLQKQIDQVCEKAVATGAEIICEEAKNEIGTYQEEAGPFVAWAELADSTKRDRKYKGFSENEPLKRTGELRASIQYTAIGYQAVIGSDDDVAVYQELGTYTLNGMSYHIPPRSFLGGAAFRKGHVVASIINERIYWLLCGMPNATARPLSASPSDLSDLFGIDLE
jgi:phage gpG-like protein